jgi:hypothetical protein
MLDFFAMVWFFVGNYWLFTSEDCRALAPSLWWLSLAWIILGYGLGADTRTYTQRVCVCVCVRERGRERDNVCACAGVCV